MKQHWKKLTATVTALALALTLLPPIAAQAMAIKAYELVYEPTYQQLVSESSFTAKKGFSPRGAVGNTLIVREGVYVTPDGVLSESDGDGNRYGVEYLVTVKTDGTVTRKGPFMGVYWSRYHIGEFNEAVYAVAYDLHGKCGIVRSDGWAVDPANSKYSVYSSLGTGKYVGAVYKTGPDAFAQVLLDLESMQEVNYTKPDGVILDISEYSGGNLIPGWSSTDECYNYYDLSGNKAFDGRTFESAYAFSNGYAWVREDGVYKLINTDGVVIFTDSNHAYDGYHGLVSKNNIAVTEMGYVDLNGNIFCQRGRFDKQSDEVFHPFRNGYGRIDVFTSVVEAAYGDALVDTKGNTVISPEDNLKILGDISADGYFIGLEAYDNGWEYSIPQLYCLGKTAVLNKATTTVPYSDQLPEGHTYTLSSGSLPAGLTLSATGEISGTPTATGTYQFTVQQDGTTLLPCTLTVLENSGSTTLQLPDAVKFVPYSTQLTSISVNQVQFTYALATDSSLPDGLSLSEAGEISGIPTKSGTFEFTVRLLAGQSDGSARGGGGNDETYSIEIKDNSDSNVADNVPEGYVIKEEVDDMRVTALSDQVFEIKSYSVEEPTQEEENFGDFMEVYLDGRKLVGGKIEGEITLETIPAEWEYYAEKGSTKITIRAQTFAKAGIGMHTIAAEFRKDGKATGELKTVAQNFNITSTSSGGGGGGAVSTAYKVTAPQTVGGKIAVTPENAAAGKTVTLRVTPDVGYQLREITVGDVKLTKVDDSTYTFTMPKNKVEIKAAFEKIASANTTFTDIDESAWYFEAARYVYENGLMRGVTEDSFAPEEMMTRAMLLTVLSRYAGAEIETTGQNWYVQSVEWAKANGISDGLNPEENITREQVATMLYRYAHEPEVVADLSMFGDESSVNAYAAKAVQWAVANGLINGMDGKLAPQAFATRAQLAAIIMRYCENVAK